VTLDGYWLVAVSGEYPVSDHLYITARVENAFDTDYEDVFGFQNPGRGVYAGLRARF
jgi:vitamin B12 transporter